MNARRPVSLALLTLIVFSTSCTKKTPTLNLLVWEGYADPTFVKAFEEQHHCRVSASYMGSSDELVAKLRGGSAGNYDVISPSSDVATSIASADLAAPLLGIFGNDDSHPSPAQVDLHEEELKRHGKDYEFHRYDGASHGFFYYQAPMYRPEAAMDGWAKIFAFFDANLSS